MSMTILKQFETMTALACALAVLGGGAALATDQTLPGNKILVLDRQGQGELLHVSKLETLNLKIPTPGGPDDPTKVGASVTIYNPNTCESATFDLPASNWRMDHAETVPAFKFSNRNAPAPPSEVQQAEIRIDRLKILARASGIMLDESSQGSVGVVLTAGSQRYCTLFGGTILHDKPGMFSALLAPAPASCPPFPCVTRRS
jgi:hypothetical protein